VRGSLSVRRSRVGEEARAAEEVAAAAQTQIEAERAAARAEIEGEVGELSAELRAGADVGVWRRCAGVYGRSFRRLRGLTRWSAQSAAARGSL
jgi:hypothetical protein